MYILLQTVTHRSGRSVGIMYMTQYVRIRIVYRPVYLLQTCPPHPFRPCLFTAGHATLLADQNFADFCQEIGIASIGATDEQITQLSRCFWYVTVRFVGGFLKYIL